MPSPTACRRELEALHAWFVDWFTGQTGEDTIDRLDGALAPDFEMVTPEGQRRTSEDVVAGIADDYAADDSGTFEIEIRNVETRYAVDDHALLRYEEWQHTATGTTARLSTVLFTDAPGAPSGVEWADLHETWLDAPDVGDG